MNGIVKPKNKRLNIDLPLVFYNDVKSVAATNNISLKEYVFRALVEKMIKDKQEIINSTI